MSPIYMQMIRSSVLGTLALGAKVFIPAGTLNYWQGAHISVRPFLLPHSTRSIS